jgi:hypothetical protein
MGRLDRKYPHFGMSVIMGMHSESPLKYVSLQLLSDDVTVTGDSRRDIRRIPDLVHLIGNNKWLYMEFENT